MTSRHAALSRLHDFIPRVPEYASNRNYVRPDYEQVSRLSRWIRYRVVTEEECVATVLKHHSREVAEKFLQEILWRTYWKGWLELRPSVWVEYLASLTTLLPTFEQNESYKRALAAETALSFFNDWVSELLTTGYLHNHTRMWFASVWIFTLKLPWQLGARFMYQHLLDGDPASNTLSWRWVAGLHTPGKIYVARPHNISTYSESRWQPKESELITSPESFYPRDTPAPSQLIPATSSPPETGALIVLHDDDLAADLSPELSAPETRYFLYTPGDQPSSNLTESFRASVRNDTAKRCNAVLSSSAGEIASSARESCVSQVHMMIPRVGFEQDDIRNLANELTTLGVSVVWHRRAWDERLMPLARSGFFTFWERAKPLLSANR